MPTSEHERADLMPHSDPDLPQTLERQIAAGFPPELAFDLVLHELVVRASALTQASAAALALARGSEMVCRAATGVRAPDLGVPLNTLEGLSGVCLHTRQAALCYDTESDPLVDAEAARQLGIRSMLIVPVIENDSILGILEVFSSQPAAFASYHQTILERLASECVRLHQTMIDVRTRPLSAVSPAPLIPAPEHEESDLEQRLAAIEYFPTPAPPPRLYEGWTLVLGGVVILAAAALSFMIGARVGWIRTPFSPSAVRVSKAATPQAPPHVPQKSGSFPSRNASKTGTAAPKSDELVVYDRGKVVFRENPERKSGDPIVPAAASSRLSNLKIWLAPEAAEKRLLSRVEPTYPAAALASHSAGDVVLEIVVGEDGSVAAARALKGDPVLGAAALDAVKQWRYAPYQSNQHPAPFKTDVTLRFSLPD